MELTRETLLTKLLASYSQWYDLKRAEEEAAPLAAVGQFHEHGTGYVLVRKAEMWSADSHEYLYIYSMPLLTLESYTRCLAQARELGEALIKPDKQHRSSYIVALFLCDAAEEAAVQALKKCRVRKSFQFSLQGWMEVHTAVVELGTDSIVSNPDGRRTAKFLKSVLHPRKKDLWYKLFRK